MSVMIRAPRPRLGALELAIYSTVAYRDMFEFPVTVAEIHRYLHGERCSQDDVVNALSGLLDGRVVSDGTYYALSGRQRLFQVRQARREISRRQRPVALRFVRFLASLPNVRMVAMTGSLAANNCSDDGDIDFLLLTDGGAMWRTRALCRLLAHVDQKLGKGLFCPNMFLSSAAMTLVRRSLYDAQELCQMIPLFGIAEYQAVREANRWTERYLPNAQGAPEVCCVCKPYWPTFKHFAEWCLESQLGRGLERFEADRKIHRFNETDRLKGAWTRSTREAHSVWDDVRLKIEGAWRHRMDAIASD